MRENPLPATAELLGHNNCMGLVSRYLGKLTNNVAERRLVFNTIPVLTTESAPRFECRAFQQDGSSLSDVASTL